MKDEFQIPTTGFQRILNMICLVLQVGTFLFLLYMWSSLPARIPTHYDVLGVIDGWGSKWSVWFLPVISLVLYGVISVLERYPGSWNTGVRITENNRAEIYRLLKDMIIVLKTALVLAFSYISVGTATNRGLGAWFLPGMILLVFAPMGYYLIRIARVPK